MDFKDDIVEFSYTDHRHTQSRINAQLCRVKRARERERHTHTQTETHIHRHSVQGQSILVKADTDKNLID